MVVKTTGTQENQVSTRHVLKQIPFYKIMSRAKSGHLGHKNKNKKCNLKHYYKHNAHPHCTYENAQIE